jgi:hypothetical protein
MKAPRAPWAAMLLLVLLDLLDLLDLANERLIEMSEVLTSLCGRYAVSMQSSSSDQRKSSSFFDSVKRGRIVQTS